MTLIEKVRAVEQVYEKLDADIADFRNWSQLRCKTGCGKCCFKPDIEATVLEFLPFAHYLYKNELALRWISDLQDAETDLCRILDVNSTGAGMCSAYPHRGLICRLFGFSARTNKFGRKELVTCGIIKAEQAALFEKAAEKIAEEGPVPVMNHYYMQLHGIDRQLAQDFYPINVAIRKAIETVLHYYAYRE